MVEREAGAIDHGLPGRKTGLANGGSIGDRRERVSAATVKCQ